jgi:NTP pyrophosphatase (non-canonical NTP hydrolase)
MSLQKDILDWAEETFGVNTDLKIAIRGNKEMAELVSTISNGMGTKDIGEECADVAFFLMQICEKHGVDLYGEIAAKLVINRKRSWEIASDGSHQHVKGT